MRQSLDQYITGGRPHRESETLTCKNCGMTFEWNLFCEYGGCWFGPEDVVCPYCDTDYIED